MYGEPVRGTRANITGRKSSKRRLIVVKGDAELTEIVDALCSTGCFPRRLYGREQERDQNANNCNDNEQLNECKSAFFCVHDASCRLPLPTCLRKRNCKVNEECRTRRTTKITI